MKRSYIFIILTLLSSAISAQMNTSMEADHFFSLEKNKNFTFECYDASGNVEAYYSYKIVDMIGDLNDGKVEYDYRFHDMNGKPLFGDDDDYMKMIITLNDEGTASTMSDIGKATKIQNLIFLGDVTTLPSELTVGEQVPAGVINVKIKGVGAKFTISERKVVAVEDITTRGGTFRAYKMTEKQNTKVLISSKDYYFTSWYVIGIGAVKQQVYDKKGKLLRSQELLSIEN